MRNVAGVGRAWALAAGVPGSFFPRTWRGVAVASDYSISLLAEDQVLQGGPRVRVGMYPTVLVALYSTRVRLGLCLENLFKIYRSMQREPCRGSDTPEISTR